jgi:hypothetical protein
MAIPAGRHTDWGFPLSLIPRSWNARESDVGPSAWCESEGSPSPAIGTSRLVSTGSRISRLRFGIRGIFALGSRGMTTWIFTTTTCFSFRR